MKWLKRLGVIAAVALGLVLLVLAFPAARYVKLAVEDGVFAEVEHSRLAAAPKAVIEVVRDAGPRCLQGVVMQNGVPVAAAAVSAAPTPRAAGAACGCERGCDCPAALEALFVDEARIAASLAEAVGTSTDAAGHFTLCTLPSGPLMVWAEGARGAVAQTDVTWPTERTVRLTLSDAVTLTVRVVDREGHAIAKAEALVVSAASTPTVHAVTNERGELTAAVSNTRITLVVKAAGYVPITRSLFASSVPQLVRLERSIEAFVTVVDQDRPVAGARVVTRASSQAVLTDASGVAHLTQLSVDGDRITARKGSRVGTLAFAPPATVTSSKLTLELGPGYVVQGRVTQNNAPAVTMPVVVRHSDQWDLRQAVKTDADGGYTTDGFEPGRYVVSAFGTSCSKEASGRITDGPLTVNFDLDCPAGIQGRVVTRQGRPLPDATVSASCGPVSDSVQTNDDGYFSFSVPPGLCSLAVKDTRVSAFSKRVMAPSTGVSLVCDEGASVRGHVVDAEGQPVRQAHVLVMNALASQAIVDVARQGSERGDARSDDQGDFEIGGLPAGRYEVGVVAADDQPRGLAVGKQFVLNPEEHHDVGTLVLSAGATISGVVRNEAGEPIAGADVRPEIDAKLATGVQAFSRAAMGDYEGAARSFAWSASTDALGRFTMANAQDTTTLRVKAYGFEPATVSVTRKNDVNVVLKRAPKVMVRGRVLGTRRAPLTEFRVEGAVVWDADGRFEVAVELPDERPRDDDDGLLVAAMKEGDPNTRAGTIDVAAKGYASRTMRFRRSVTAVGPVELGDIELEATHRTVTVVQVTAVKDGAPIRGATVSIEAGGETEHDTTDAQGSARIEHLRGGGFVRATGTAFESASTPLVDGTETIELRLEPASRRIEGVALGLDGRPAAGSSVSVAEARATVDDDGRYVLEHIRAGAAQVVLETPSMTWGVRLPSDAARLDVGQVPGGGTAELVLLSPGPLLLTQGEGEPMEGNELFTDNQSSNGAFAFSPMMPPGTARLTGLVPGKWSVYFFSVSERGLTALYKSQRLAPRIIDVRQGETARLSFE